MGDMSLVGPRPLLSHYLDRYTPTQARRHEVKPGITGWAQINGRNALSWDQKFELDVWYVDHRSLSLDFLILWKTIRAIFTGHGLSQDNHATMPEFQLTFPTWPSFTPAEIEAVSAVLHSGKVNYWTGSECREFEKEFASFVGTQHAIAMMNGTVTMEAALYALGIGPGDEVIVPSHTFIASASAVVMRGATPIVADIDPDSNSLNAQTIQAKLTPKTKAIIVVHLGGWPAEMDEIMALANAHQLFVIEDCAQAHGAEYKGRPVGSIGHIGSFSFCQDKIMTTGGEGGMVVTNDPILWQKMWEYKDHGKSFEAVYHRQHAPGFRWLHESFGTNFRMTDMQAAIGRIQLGYLPEWRKKRAQNAHILVDYFSKIPALRVPTIPDYVQHAYYKLYVYTRPDALPSGWSRDRIVSTLNEQGIPCFHGGCSEIYREKAFIDAGLAPTDRFPTAKTQGETSLMFLIHPTLTEWHMHRAGQAVQAIFV
jgi:dTDP-4-amino-4,6-dideoxygalactose transaminase